MTTKENLYIAVTAYLAERGQVLDISPEVAIPLPCKGGNTELVDTMILSISESPDAPKKEYPPDIQAHWPFMKPL